MNPPHVGYSMFGKQVSFNLMATVPICSDFGAQENIICHYFHFFPFYLPWNDRTSCHALNFLNVEFQVSFFTLLFHSHQEAGIKIAGRNSNNLRYAADIVLMAGEEELKSLLMRLEKLAWNFLKYSHGILIVLLSLAFIWLFLYCNS